MDNIFKYNVGMYGGCFDPLHTGHLSVLYRAASECKELYVVLSYSIERDHTFYRLRWQWLNAATKCLNNVKILLLEDTCKSKEEYDTEANWYEGSVKVKQMIGKKIDVIYCSTEYDWKGSPYNKFYPEAKLEFVDRNIIPISSTQIRDNPYKYWEYIPSFVRPNFVKKVLICGTESTGKSTLTQLLANKYCTTAISEYGRIVCENCGSELAMTNADFEEILVKHKAAIIDGMRVANKVLFIDTDALTTYFYALHSKCIPDNGILKDDKLLKKFIDTYDLILICNSDVPFVDDGIRIVERNKDRNSIDYWFRMVYSSASNNGLTNKIVDLSGNYAKRLEDATNNIEKVIFRR